MLARLTPAMYDHAYVREEHDEATDIRTNTASTGTVSRTNKCELVIEELRATL